MTQLRNALAVACLAVAFAGCEGRQGDDHAESDHAHGAGDDTFVYTSYSAATELFVEFPALVVDNGSRFAAHVTRLADFGPLTSGTMDVALLENSRTVARFRVTAPARDGIFAPVVTPKQAGEFDLVIEVADGDLRARHELGRVTVFADAHDVVVDQPELEGDIGYLKEQQWLNPFATSVVAEQPLRPSVPGFATVLPPADAGAEIRAPSDGYFAQHALVRAGQRVAAGEVLGYLVPRLGEGSDFGTLVVALERARSQQLLAEQDVERLAALYAQGAVPERRLNDARQALEVARAEFSTARARVEQYERGGSRAGVALRSPVDGIVIEVNAGPGAYVRAADRVFRVAAPDRRWLQVLVPEKFAMGLQNSSGAWIKDASGNATLLDASTGARVVQTATAIDPATRTASVTIEYPTTQGPDAIGARFAAHVFVAPPEMRVSVPRGAVIFDGGRSVVFVQTGGESFVRRPVELGFADADRLEVLSGVVPGERVVAEGAYYVKLAAAAGEEIGHGHAH